MELPPRARRIHTVDYLLGQIIGTTSACAENTRFSPNLPSSVGTTSACAENTRPYPHGEAEKWNYLRVRGEYSWWISKPYRLGELPPRARRIPAEAEADAPSPGTTSACAENTGGVSSTGGVSRNYLRVRGEYLRAPDFHQVAGELPPRARRIQRDRWWAMILDGTTSACAENT